MMKYLLLCLAVAFSFTAFSQHDHKIEIASEHEHPLITQMPPGNKIHRCASAEYDAYRRDKYGQATVDEFEAFMATRIAEAKKNPSKKGATLITIPTVVHVIHRGEAVGSMTNISTEHIMSQLQQLNDDFRRTPGTLGFNDHRDGADVEIEFCPVLRDPDGNDLAEPGINRVNAITSGLGAGVYSIAEFDMVVKEATQWDPERYFNFWSADLGGGVILGYAQFPASDQPGLEGNNNGAAEHDGIVCLYSTIGGEEVPAPNAPYDLGRTGTHEVGHWVALRHIWGDGDCAQDDFVLDTPNAEDSNGGCPAGTTEDPRPNTCDDTEPVDGDFDFNAYFRGLGENPIDQMENYMDYSADRCFNMFTQGQKDRVRILFDDAVAKVPRRYNLQFSDACTPQTPRIAFNSAESMVDESTDCNTTQTITVPLRIELGASQEATVTVEATGGGATEGKDFIITNGTATFEAGSTDMQDITIDIIHDGATEGMETIELTITTIDNNSGDAVISNANKHTITINDDDVEPIVASSEVVEKVREDFESGMDGWSVTAGTREENNGTLLTAKNVWTVNDIANGGTGLGTGNNSAYITTTITPTDLHVYDSNTETRNVIFTRIDATGLKNIKVDFKYICLGEPDPLGTAFDFGTIVAAPVVDGANERPAFVRIKDAPLLHSTPNSTAASFTLPESFNGQVFDLGFEWFNDTNAGGPQPLSVDDIVISGDQEGVTPIQTVVETDSKLVYKGQTVHFYGALGNVIATISSASEDLGCTTVEVITDGNGTNIDLDDVETGAKAASKTIRVTPSNSNTDANYQVSLYYTKTEIDTWIDNTSITIDDFKLFRVNNETTAAADNTNTKVDNSARGTYDDVNGQQGFVFTSNFTNLTTYAVFGGLNATANNDALAAELITFTGNAANNQVFLNWETATEVDVDYFEVERTTNIASTFATIGQKDAVAKNNAGATYQLVDTKPAVGNNYYRLKIVDINGEVSYSNTIVINFTDPSFVTNIFPNPAKDVVFVSLNDQASDVKVIVRNYLGQVVETSFTNNGQTLEIATNRLASGTYFLEIDSNLGREVKRIVINE